MTIPLTTKSFTLQKYNRRIRISEGDKTGPLLIAGLFLSNFSTTSKKSLIPGALETPKEMLTKRDTHQVTTKWLGKMHFESTVNEHHIHLDKLPQHGGEDSGPRPKPLILAAIGGCTGMEILVILEKMRLHIDRLEIDVTGELNDGQPKIYKSVHIVFNVTPGKSPVQKVEHAILLAAEKYCGVVAMVKHFATVTSEIKFF